MTSGDHVLCVHCPALKDVWTNQFLSFLAPQLILMRKRYRLLVYEFEERILGASRASQPSDEHALQKVKKSVNVHPVCTAQINSDRFLMTWTSGIYRKVLVHINDNTHIHCMIMLGKIDNTYLFNQHGSNRCQLYLMSEYSVAYPSARGRWVNQMPGERINIDPKCISPCMSKCVAQYNLVHR
jgi:hypothetical protein